VKPFEYQRKRAESNARHIRRLRERIIEAPLADAWTHRAPDVLFALMLQEQRGRRAEARLLDWAFPPEPWQKSRHDVVRTVRPA
jgi:hypothetical protein